MNKIHLTLAIIQAAGYGTRMGKIKVPKAMLKGKDNIPLIDEALGLSSESIDFAVMSKSHKFFSPLNSYLLEKGLSKDKILFQTSRPRSHTLAFIFEFYKSLYFFFGSHDRRRLVRTINAYDALILIPSDNKYKDYLNLEDLTSRLYSTGSDLMIVYSKKTGPLISSAKEDYIIIDNNNNLSGIRRKLDDDRSDYDNASDEKNEILVTSPGVYAFKRKTIYNPTIIPQIISWLIHKSISGTGYKVQAYFMKPGWDGARDTIESLKSI